MKVLITGMRGTLAPYVARAFETKGWETQAWDRSTVSPEDTSAVETFLATVKPDVVCHLAMGAESWAKQLAKYCATENKKFLFTSTAMVFNNEPDGPHNVTDERTARDDYGLYKIRCEDEITSVNPKATIVRIGWQIGDSRGGNNMLEALHQMHEKGETIRASTTWFPATSFMSDTSAMVCQLLEESKVGIFHLDSNYKPRLSYLEIVKGLKKLHNADWKIEACEDYHHDQRLAEERIEMPSILERLS